jgi:hypothetical protein
MSPGLDDPPAWIPGNPAPLLSVSALDHLRRMAREAGAAATFNDHSRLDTPPRYSQPSDEDLEKAAEEIS